MDGLLLKLPSILCVAGVAKLNRSELETACEDFSNIINNMGGSIVYKGTLSSGVEIAVSSTSVACLKDWSNNAEKGYKNKVIRSIN